MRCGTCGGRFINLNAERVGCAAARFKGTCDNRRTMRRDTLDNAVLEGLQHHLMDPVLCDLFCQEYTKEMNRLHGEKNAQRDEDRRALTKVERELDRLVQALMDGVPASCVKDKMAELERRKAELESRLTGNADNAVLLHPRMAGPLQRGNCPPARSHQQWQRKRCPGACAAADRPHRPDAS